MLARLSETIKLIVWKSQFHHSCTNNFTSCFPFHEYLCFFNISNYYYFLYIHFFVSIVPFIFILCYFCLLAWWSADLCKQRRYKRQNKLALLSYISLFSILCFKVNAWMNEWKWVCIYIVFERSLASWSVVNVYGKKEKNIFSSFDLAMIIRR
jgi:hypothetical protein